MEACSANPDNADCFDMKVEEVRWRLITVHPPSFYEPRLSFAAVASGSRGPMDLLGGPEGTGRERVS